MNKCGDHGFKTKDGTPCGYRIPETATSCPHHDPNGPSRARSFQSKGTLAAQYRRIPEQIQAGDLRTVEALRDIYGQVIETATKQKGVDLKVLDTVLKALSGASNLLQVDAVNTLADALARTEGHGQGLLVLERLKQTKLRPVAPPRRLPEPDTNREHSA